MGLWVQNLKPGDAIIFRDACDGLPRLFAENNNRHPGPLVETTVNGVSQVGDKWYVYVDGSHTETAGDFYFQRAVQNLVPKEKQDHRHSGNTPYKVLTFRTDAEYNHSPVLKNRIVARFADYWDALRYAQSKAFLPMYAHVVLQGG